MPLSDWSLTLIQCIISLAGTAIFILKNIFPESFAKSYSTGLENVGTKNKKW